MEKVIFWVSTGAITVALTLVAFIFRDTVNRLRQRVDVLEKRAYKYEKAINQLEIETRDIMSDIRERLVRIETILQHEKD